MTEPTTWHERRALAYQTHYMLVRHPGQGVLIHAEGPAGKSQVRHVKHHSADLEMGYAGSGPADAALSLLAHLLGEDPSPQRLRQRRLRCWRLHQEFKRRFIAPIRGDFTTLSGALLIQWVEAAEAALDPVPAWSVNRQGVALLLCSDCAFSQRRRPNPLAAVPAGARCEECAVPVCPNPEAAV